MRALRELLSSPGGRIGGLILFVYLLLALAGLLSIVPYDPLAMFPAARLQGPSAAHIMGTDLFGRDVCELAF